MIFFFFFKVCGGWRGSRKGDAEIWRDTVATLAGQFSAGQQPARYYSQIYRNADGCTQPKEADILASAVIRMT